MQIKRFFVNLKIHLKLEFLQANFYKFYKFDLAKIKNFKIKKLCLIFISPV